jgi:hypothetical protein
MTLSTRVLSLGVLFLFATGASAQPAKYKVTLRYYIPAPRDQHVMQYDAMIKHVESLKWEFDPAVKRPETDREDRSKNYLKGTIALEDALKLLAPRVVQSILLVPDDFKLPDGADDPVLVRLEIGGNLTADRQRELTNQTRVLLRELGFVEPAGYDHRGYSRRPYTRIVGTIPASKLDLLLRDLRFHPAGWLGPIIPREEMPLPLRDINPVTVIEVLPDSAAIKVLPEPEPRGDEIFDKISLDLWALVKDKDAGSNRVRVQVGFVGNLTTDDRDWKLMLQELTPGFAVEGQLGHFVTGTLRLDQVKRLALSPLVSVIRLPRPPRVDVAANVKVKGDNAKALEQSNLKELHARGYKGQGVRIGIIDRDFRGWETLVQKKLLPAKTRLVDLTTELDPEAYPAPNSGDPDQIGHGTLCAQAAALAAPDAEVVLIRVDTLDPHHLVDVARYCQGGRYSNTVELRAGEMLAQAAELSARREELLKERKAILDDFTDESDLKDYLEFLGPFYTWLYSDRDWHRGRMEYHEKQEATHRLREERFRQHLKAIRTLDGIPIVVNAPSWNSGYPLGAISPLSKLLDDPRKVPLWFQAVGNTRGQTWLGPYRSTPGDPALKFSTDDKTPKGRWSNEVNFLAWQPYQGDAKPELPKDAKLRITMQWREPHDPDYYLQPGEEDDYRKPLASMKLQLLRQREPESKLMPDVFDLVGRTTGLAERIEHLPAGSVYEHVLEVPLSEAGRYAIRVEKQVSTQWMFVPHPVRKSPMFHLLENLTPTGVRPLGAPTLPALEKNWELKPRIFVEVIDDANRMQGRAVFADFATEAGSIGVPADARNVISVGAANFKNQPEPYSAFGSPSGMEMARRPWLYAYDELELAGGGAFGTSVANAFAAGTTAAMLSGKLPREQVVQILREQEGQVLRVPLGKK